MVEFIISYNSQRRYFYYLEVCWGELNQYLRNLSLMALQAKYSRVHLIWPESQSSIMRRWKWLHQVHLWICDRRFKYYLPLLSSSKRLLFSNQNLYSKKIVKKYEKRLRSDEPENLCETNIFFFSFEIK